MNLRYKFIMKYHAKPLKPFYILIGIMLIGVMGFHWIEGWTYLDSLFMVVITLSTVGYEEPRQLSLAGEAFTILLIISGVGTVGYSIGRLAEFMLEGQLLGLTRRRRMERNIRNLKGHYILCGYGRLGKYVSEELKEQEVPFLVIENKEAPLKELSGSDMLFIEGDASDDDILEEAGVKQAKGLVAAVGDDALNVFIALSARNANPDIYIVARANEPETEPKLKKAGANRVVSPNVIAGRRMAGLVVQPAAIDFLDTVIQHGKMELRIEECEIKSGSFLEGKTLQDSQIRQRSGVMVVAIRHPDGKFDLNPSTEVQIHSADILIIMGTPAQCCKMNQLASSPE